MSSSSVNSGSDIPEAIKPLISRCVDCGGDLSADLGSFTCDQCSRTFNCDEHGVWRFEPDVQREPVPKIYREEEFQRWLEVFRQQESKNWVIYKNRLFRFFAQAGHRILGHHVQRSLGNGDKLLEIGAGTGTLLEYVDAPLFVALDTSAESLAVLKKKWPHAVCICGSASHLPFASKSFEHVVSLHTLEHVYLLAEALEEIERVLLENGKMHYVIPTEGGAAFSIGRFLVTGPHLRRKYDLDVGYVMDREHINDAKRVLKFLRMHFDLVEARYWPLPLLRFLSVNAMIYGNCHNNKSSDPYG